MKIDINILVLAIQNMVFWGDQTITILMMKML